MRRYKQFRSSPEQVSAFPSVGSVSDVQTVVRRRYPQFGTAPNVAATLLSLGVPAGGSAYVLTCDAGAYVLAGQDATLLRGRVVAADAGSYITTGQDSTFIYAGSVTYAANANLYLGIGSELSIMLGGPRMPFWATAGRPSTPLNGIYGFNTDTNAIEVWNGASWV